MKATYSIALSFQVLSFLMNSYFDELSVWDFILKAADWVAEKGE